VVPIVRELLEEAAGKHDVLFLDGAVRTVTQLYHVSKFAKANGCLHVVIYIGTPHYVLEERLTRLAKTMERSRNDDNIASIPRRLRNHWNMTEIIRRILERHQNPNFRSFDGTLHPDKIFAEVTTFLDSFNIFPKVEASA
jgi:adenylate kinase family enzyme